MSIPYNLLRVHTDTAAIVRNYSRLQHAGGRCMAVVKADAYGHGLARTAQALAAAGCDELAVGTVAEAVYLRDTGFQGRIVALLGPQDAAEGLACVQGRILPLVGHLAQLHTLAEAAQQGAEPLPVALKFDTGMRRLGFRASEVPPLLELLATLPQLRVTLVCSHLATADDPAQAAFAQEQGQEFTAICAALRPLGAFETSLANSAGILAHPDLHRDVQRPGIALYGANPLHDTPWADKGAGLEPAMRVTAPVLQVRELAAGESVSYGRTYRASAPTRLAIVAAGYADAYSRGLSSATGQGPCMLVRGRRAPIVGRVCMQMTAVDVGPGRDVRPGDEACLLGEQAGPDGRDAITAEELAAWWGTIPYEVFCVLGLNPRG